MFEKILVTLDGSELAELALPYAEEFAGKMGSELILLHVVQSIDDPYSRILQPYFEKMLTNIKCNIEKYLSKYQPENIKLDIKILVGHPAEQIIDYADIKGVDLIIMATHGRSGIRRWSLGSVADKVVRSAKKPVLLVRAGNPHAQISENGIFRKIVVPLDGSKASESIIPYVKELANKINSKLYLLVVEDPDFYVAPEYAVASFEDFQSMKSAARSYLEIISKQSGFDDKNVNEEVVVGLAAEKIIDYAKELDADCIAMATHGRSGASRWIFGSVATKVLNEGTLPLLIVRAPGF